MQERIRCLSTDLLSVLITAFPKGEVLPLSTKIKKVDKRFEWLISQESRYRHKIFKNFESYKTTTSNVDMDSLYSNILKYNDIGANFSSDLSLMLKRAINIESTLINHKLLHSEDKPALVFRTCVDNMSKIISELWFYLGKLHRIEAAAVIFNIAGPIVRKKTYYIRNGLLHRLDGPAIIIERFVSGENRAPGTALTHRWYKNGKKWKCKSKKYSKKRIKQKCHKSQKKGDEKIQTNNINDACKYF